jgi:uncharacterized glyoxalase superfamily protein PhnB
MRLTPYLSFRGQGEAAFKFYERCFGGKIIFMLTHGKDRQRYQRQRSYGQCHNGHSRAIARLTRQTTPLR